MDVLRLAIDPQAAAIRRAHLPELGCQKYLIAFALDRLAYQPLIIPHPVHIRSV
jgi:hypothetical protein